MNRAAEQPPDLVLQRDLLARVSRTFALTIPALPPDLEVAVGNAYLLCRIADTIEDAPTLDAAEAVRFSARFIEVVDGGAGAAELALELGPRLDGGATDDERRLVARIASVLAITGTLTASQRQAVRACVRTMARGMAEFRRRQSPAGLADLGECARYCYIAAGVVGEMLTRLFVEHAPELEPRRERLMRLAPAFGEALQLTNILKDVWEDRARGACWLPRSVFAEEGLELRTVAPGTTDPRLGRAWARLIGLARADLERALAYTLALPRAETGMRNFCLWALFMAVLTLRKIHQRPGFASGAEVKIRRSTVGLVVTSCRLAVRSDGALRAAFALASAGLPRPDPRDRVALAAAMHGTGAPADLPRATDMEAAP